MIKRGDVVRGWLTRPAMLGFWALAFWGTLLAVTAAVEAASEGVPSVWQTAAACGRRLDLGLAQRRLDRSRVRCVDDRGVARAVASLATGRMIRDGLAQAPG